MNIKNLVEGVVGIEDAEKIAQILMDATDAINKAHQQLHILARSKSPSIMNNKSEFEFIWANDEKIGKAYNTIAMALDRAALGKHHDKF